jgi:RNA polymerase sigma-70 factor (ECF subfamily)
MLHNQEVVANTRPAGTPHAPPFRCVLEAWQAHETEVRRYLIGRVRDRALADDLLQEVFVRAIREGERFCALDSARAWLFQVARNAHIDHQRHSRRTVPVPDDLPQPAEPGRPVDALSGCLEIALQALDADDRDVIGRCDLGEMTQGAYADARGLTLPAVKSRIQRARVRLRQHLIDRCGVRMDDTGRVCCHGASGPEG